MEINKTALGIAAGVAGTLFLGYCIYFDKKRREDPDYKKKVRERRRRQRKSGNGGGKSEIPNLNDHEAIERYFLQEIQLGESLIATGDFERGVEHLANAIVVCGQPTRLLQILQTSLPAQVFAMLIQKMQEYGNRAAASGGGEFPGGSDQKPRIIAAKVGGPSLVGNLGGGGDDSIDDLE